MWKTIVSDLVTFPNLDKDIMDCDMEAGLSRWTLAYPFNS